MCWWGWLRVGTEGWRREAGGGRQDSAPPVHSGSRNVHHASNDDCTCFFHPSACLLVDLLYLFFGHRDPTLFTQFASLLQRTRIPTDAQGGKVAID